MCNHEAVSIVVCVGGFFRSRLLLSFVEVAIVVADTVFVVDSCHGCHSCLGCLIADTP